MQKMLSIILFIFSTSALALDLPEKRQEFISPDEAFKMSVTDINDNQMVINWEIEEGYYLYMGMFEFSTDQEEVQIIEATMPDGTRKVDEFFGDVDVFYHNTSVKLVFDKIVDGANLIVKYQGCADAGLCYPPIKKIVSLDEYSSKDSFFLKTSSSNNQYSITQQLNDQSIIFNIFLFLLA